ncbi:unnamed protein product [Rotaria socialis]|uniref:N-acetylglucosamine-6-phosphate deacetylase n=1 Tax=Rotaria socialis TaxID=392032 RepID=A0A820RBE8_9BILA|nr:unnamed protein product [Rotaria socialis]
MTLYRFRNCKLLRNHALIIDDLWIRNGKIADPEKIFFDEKILADIEYDCQGILIAPGYIDLQINGAFGHDFSSPDTASEAILIDVARKLASHGVTAFLPTIVSSNADAYKTILPKYKRRAGSAKDGAAILGMHLEGPFIDKEKHGAHRTECLLKAPHGTEDLLACYGSFDNVSIVTLAPEIPNMIEKVIPELVDRYGLVVSIGHSVASLDEGERAVCSGVRFITHLFNAMLGFHHRHPNLLGLLTSHRVPATTVIHYGLIADGIHTHSATIRLAHRVHPQGLVLVTDALDALGLPEGIHRLGPQEIAVKNKRATIAGTETLCGSIASMTECVQNMRQALLDGETNKCNVKNLSENDKDKFIVDSIEAATLHPASVLRIEKQKGTLSYGADADFIFLDDKLNVLSTFIAGEQAWTITDEWSIDNIRINPNKNFMSRSPKVYLTRRETFSASHRLHSTLLSDNDNIQIFNKCNNPNGHGHNYVLEVTVIGHIDDNTGMVMNISDLKELIQIYVLTILDHKHLDLDVEYFRTKNIVSTTENLSVFIWEQLCSRIQKQYNNHVQLYEIKLYETEKNIVTYRGE